MPDATYPTWQDIQAAAKRLRPHLPATPLRSYQSLDEAVGLHVLVKHENHQPTNSFKMRNGLAALTALPAAQRKRGVIAATRGNHGAGVAYAGKLLGVPVTICVPVGNNPEKNEIMRGLGAILVEEGATYDDSVAVMNRLAEKRGLRSVHSTNDLDVLAGAATMSLEIVEQAKAMDETIDAMVFAIGGGSQACGAIAVTRHLDMPVDVYGVQADGASAIHDAWRAGKPMTHSSADTFADGIATRSSYDMTFPLLREGLRDFVLVSDAEIAAGLRTMIRATHNLCEGAGAAGLAGLTKLAPKLHGKTVVVVLSGANIDQATLTRVMSGAV